MDDEPPVANLPPIEDPYATNAPPIDNPYQATLEDTEHIRAEVAEQTGISITALTGATRHEIEQSAAEIAAWKHYGPTKRTARDFGPTSLKAQFKEDKHNHEAGRHRAAGAFREAIWNSPVRAIRTLTSKTNATPFG